MTVTCTSHTHAQTLSDINTNSHYKEQLEELKRQVFAIFILDLYFLFSLRDMYYLGIDWFSIHVIYNQFLKTC